MNAYSKALVVCLVFVSFGAAAQYNESSSSGGSSRVLLYHTNQPVPRAMLADNNVVKDYSHYHVSKPTENHEWVFGINDELVLVATKTGIVDKIVSRPGIDPGK